MDQSRRVDFIVMGGSGLLGIGLILGEQKIDHFFEYVALLWIALFSGAFIYEAVKVEEDE